MHRDAAKAEPHAETPSPTDLLDMELEEAEAKLNAVNPIWIDLLELGLDEDMDVFVTKLGGNSAFLNRPMWFDQPMPDMLEDGPTVPMVMSFFGSVSVLRHCLEVGFDASIVDSFGRSVEHFAAAGGSMDILRLLLDNIEGLRVDLLDRAGRSPADYAALMGRADLLEALLTRGAPVALRDGEDTVVLPTLAFLGHIKAISVLMRFELPMSSDPRTNKSQISHMCFRIPCSRRTRSGRFS
jgi:hypothetical protein